MFSKTISPPIPIIKNYGNSGRLIKRKHTLMLSIEINFSNDNISIETEDFKSMIYNQPVDNNFTLSLCERRTTCLRICYWPLSGGQKQNQKPTGQ